MAAARVERSAGVHRIIIEYAPPEPAEPPKAPASRKWWGTLMQLLLVAGLLAALLWAALQVQGTFPQLLRMVLGAIGGIVHEVLQSGGRIALPGVQKDGEVYLGSLGGGLLAGFAGIATPLTGGGIPDPLIPVLSGFGVKSAGEAVVSLRGVHEMARAKGSLPGR